MLLSLRSLWEFATSSLSVIDAARVLIVPGGGGSIGDFVMANPGESNVYSLDFSSRLPAGDSISSFSVAIAVYKGVDAGYAGWLIGSPFMTGKTISQKAGGAMPNGLQPGVVYRLTYTVSTAAGLVFTPYAHVVCAPVA